MSDFKIAIAGLGWWGKLMINRLSVSKDLDIAYLIDPQPDDDAIILAKSKNLNIFNDFNEAINNNKIDGIILCTPNIFHMDQTIKAANLGIHVFCEKPLSLQSFQVLKMIEACKNNDVILGVGHERRFETGWQKLHKLVTNNSLGTVMYAEGHFSHDKLANLQLDNWRTKPETAPAAGMTGMGVHLTDLMIWLFGSVKTVFASTSHRALKYKTGDVVTASLIHETGLNTQITAILKTPHYQRVTIWGENGWAELVDSSHPDTPGPSFLKITMNDGKTIDKTFEWTDTVSKNIHHFVDAAKGTVPYLFSDIEKYQNIAILEAIYNSSQISQPIIIKHL
jgi:predicted dehydrogenase